MSSVIQTPEMPSKQQIMDFVRQAHKSGWPAGLRPTTKEELYSFQEVRYVQDSWEYLDLFGGTITDIGFEVVFYQKRAVWGMSYHGGIISSDVNVNDVFAFLTQALGARDLSAPELPVRGPAKYQSADARWTYKCYIDGQFLSFLGFEQILLDGQIIYERKVIGGQFGEQLYKTPVPLCTSLLQA